MAAPSTTDAHGDALGTGLEYSGVETNGEKLCPRAVASSYEEIARWQNKRGKGGKTGAVTFVQRFDGTLGCLVHLVALDGVFTRTVQLRRQESTARGSTNTPGGYMSASCKSA